jgi:catechol 2,3-dioxygenase-like lactoylglutathione lyase family enzyme
MLSALPALVVPDVEAAVAHYRHVLGFRLPPEYEGSDELAIVDLAPGQGVQLKRGTPAPRWRRQIGAYVRLGLEALEQLAARLERERAEIVSPLADQPWGTRELRVADPAGHLLRFGADRAGGAPATPVEVWPEIPVGDPLAAAAFCRDRLGMGPADPAPDSPYFQRSRRQGVTLHWWAAPPSPFVATRLAPRNRERGPLWDVAIEVTGVDALASELSGRGVEILRGPETTDHGIRELEVAGPEGCTLCFGEDIGGP